MRAARKYIVCPAAIWESNLLTWTEKIILIEIHSMADEKGLSRVSAGALATALCIQKENVKDALAALQVKGALKTKIDGKGDTRMMAVMNAKQFEPDAEEVKAEGNAPDKTNYQEILAEWAKRCPDCAQPKRFTEKMKVQLRTLLKRNSATLDDLFTVFSLVGTSDFLTGKIKSDREWKATIYWILQDTKSCFNRILDGEFHKSERERRMYDEIMNYETETEKESYYR